MRRTNLALFALLAFSAASAHAITFPDAGAWQPVAINAPDGGVVYLGDPLGDGNNNGRDIVGDNTRPAFYIASSATNFFFRLRLNTDPTGPGGLSSYGWGILIDSDGETRDYDYVLMADGISEAIVFSKKTTKTLASDPSELADVVLSSTPTSFTQPTQNVVITPVGAGTSGFGGNEDYFLDMTIPLSTFYGANPDGGAYLNFSPSTVLRFWVGISNSSRSITLDLGGTGSQPGPGTLIGTVTTPQLLCTADLDCGGTTSGQVCTNGACGPGCRGTGGNGCPSGQTCTSTTTAVGQCISAGAPIVLTPANGSASAVKTPVISGTSPASATITVYVDGVSVGTVTATAGGTWTYTSATLADGVHTASATSTVAAVTSGMSNVNSFTIDSTPPAAPVVSAPANGSSINTATPTVTGTADPGTTVRVYVDGALVGTTTSALDGSWSFPLVSSLGAGSHTVKATSLDGVSNVSADSNTNTFTVDLTAPAAPVVVTPANGSTISTATPTWSGTAEANSTVKIYVDGTLVGTTTANGSGAWSQASLVTLTEGSHAVRATATDSATNVSGFSNTNTFTVDLTPPAAPVVLAPANGSRTSNVTPTLSGTAEANSTVSVYVDGSLACTVAASGTGAWSCTAPSTLGDGPHTVKANATDTGGNTSVDSATNTFTVDTTPPAAPVVATPANGSVTNNATPNITGTAEPGSTVRVIVDGVQVGTATADGSGNWTYTSAALGNGSHTVRAVAVDAVGNVGPSSATNTFTVDTTPPSAPVVSAPANGLVTANPSPPISGTLEANSTVTVFLDGSSVGTTVASAQGAWTFTPPSSLVDGSHTVRATSTDAAGNVSPSSNTNTFTVDTQAPAAPVVQAPANGSLIADRNPTVTGTAEANSTVRVYIDGVSAGTTTAGSNGAWSFVVPASLADGSHTARATAMDAAGNVSATSNTNTFTVDSSAPTRPSITAPSNGLITSNAQPAVTGTAEPNSTVTVFIDGVAVGTTTASGTGQWSFTPLTALADGTHTVKASSKDAANNVSPDSLVVSFTVDRTAPLAPVVVAPANGITTTDTTPTISGTSEASGLTITVRVDGQVVGIALSGTGGAWTYTSSALSLGAHTVSATATDAASNVSPSSATNSFTVLPFAPSALVLTAPADGSVTANGTPVFSGVAEAGSTVTVRVDGQVVCTATAASDGTFSCTPAQALPEGPHAATASSSNAGGTSTESDPKHFEIDLTAPLTPFIVSPAPGSSTTDTTPSISGRGEPGSLVTVSVDGQRVGAVTVAGDGTWSLEPSAPLSLGAHTVSASASDPVGNTSLPSNTNGFTIFAPNPTRPTITSPVDDASVSTATPAFSGTAQPGTLVTVLVDGRAACSATAAQDGTWTCTPSQPLGSGLHRAVAETSDGQGGTVRSDTHSFTVDVTAPLAPVVTAPAEGSTTTDTTPRVQGTAEPLSLVKVFVDGMLIGSVSADIDGTWSLDSWPLTLGAHTASATATDRAGNVSPSSAATHFTVTASTGAPVILTPTPGSATNDATPTFTGTGTPGATVDVRVDGNVVCTATASVTGAWSCTPTTPLPDGPHSVDAIDPTGTTPSATVPFVVDTVAPAAPVITSPTPNQLTSSAPVIAGTAEPGSRVTVKIDGAAVCVTLADAEGRWQCAPPTPLSQGSHTATATATDSAGNPSPTSTPVPFVVDEVAPGKPTLTEPTPGSSTTDTTPRFSGTAEPQSTVTVRVDGVTVCTTTADAQGQFSCDALQPLTRATHEAVAAATDAAGNVSQPSDAAPFTVIAVTPATPTITGPAQGAVLNDPTPALSGTGPASSTITVRDAMSMEVLCTTTADAQGRWSCESTSLADGEHVIVATADLDGGTSQPSTPTSFRVDTTPPSIVVQGTPPKPIPSSTGTVFTWTPEPETTYECSVDGGPFQACSSPLSLPGLTPGPHTVTVRATDEAGNTVETITTWLVEDPTEHTWEVVGGGVGCATVPGETLGLLATLWLLARASSRGRRSS